MPYAIIQPPFTLDFPRMSKAELNGYYDWFMTSIPVRVAGLEAEVRRSAAHAAWRADGTPGSLAALGAWFEGQVETRPSSDAEMAAIRKALTFPIEVPAEDLTLRTFSLAMDVGMYFGQVVLINVQGARWDRILKKGYADHGQPVITGLGPVPLNPVRVCVNVAYAVARKQSGRRGLPELYRVWTTMKAGG